jgi:hypothetical protein
VEGSAPLKTKEEPTNSFRVGATDVRALTTLRTFDCTNWRKIMVINLDRLAQDEWP